MLFFVILTGVACGTLLLAERASSVLGIWLSKPLAAAAYIGAALAVGALASTYGRLILVALCFSWLGDVLLIPKERPKLFLAGIASFLLAHVVFGFAFWIHGVELPALAGIGILGAGGAILALVWLRPHLSGLFRLAVPVYVVIIMGMVSLGFSAALAAGTVSIAVSIGLGALLFSISDVAVARDRFVTASFRNALWGLPLYFAAQLLLASTAASG